MRLSSLAVVGLAGILALTENPAMSVAPDAPISLAPGSADAIVFSTQGQMPSCVRRAQDCTFRPCCANAGRCRNTRNNGRVCR